MHKHTLTHIYLVFIKVTRYIKNKFTKNKQKSFYINKRFSFPSSLSNYKYILSSLCHFY